MILYLSGNFSQLANPPKELEMGRQIIEQGSDYHRLATFYYQKDCKTIFRIKKLLNKEDQK